MAKKTRLNIKLKTEIVRRIVQDIPRVDYKAEAQTYIQNRAKSELPDGLEKHLEYIGTEHLWHPFNCYVRNPLFKPTREDQIIVEQLLAKNKEQNNRIAAIEAGLDGLFITFRYMEDIKEQAPEYGKYIPEPEARIANLPAVQLTEQLHALGWPKSDEGK